MTTPAPSVFPAPSRSLQDQQWHHRRLRTHGIQNSQHISLHQMRKQKRNRRDQRNCPLFGTSALQRHQKQNQRSPRTRNIKYGSSPQRLHIQIEHLIHDDSLQKRSPKSHLNFRRHADKFPLPPPRRLKLTQHHPQVANLDPQIHASGDNIINLPPRHILKTTNRPPHPGRYQKYADHQQRYDPAIPRSQLHRQ